MKRNLKTNFLLSVSAVAIGWGGVNASSAAEEDRMLTAMEEIVVNASRLPLNIQTMPGSVSVIDNVELTKQLNVTSDLEAVLGQLVPGMGTSSASPANFTTSLRGRKPVFFIDGVPITPTLNDVGRELRLIDPSVIERIEVVRGSSALYGNSAGSGFINYITGRGEKDDLNMFTEIGTQASLTNIGNGFRPFVRQGFSGGTKKIDYKVVGYYEKIGGFFDADGDRIAPIPNGASGLADSDVYSLFAKAGLDLATSQRLEAMVTHYRQEQDTDYTLQAGDVSEGIKATAVLKDPNNPNDTEESNQFHLNTAASLTYSHSDIMGSGLRVQGFYQKSRDVFGYNPTYFPNTSKPAAQSRTESEKYGARVDIHTPLEFIHEDAVLLWGADYLHDNTYDDLVDGRIFAPPQTLKSRAVFGQIQVPLLDRFTITAGIRHEEADLKIEDFNSLFTGSDITGGTLDYSATPVNIGVTYDVTDAINLFAGFSQGFEVASVGRSLRSWPVDVDVVLLDPKPNLIDSYEGGIRGNWGNIRSTFAVFYTSSSNGLSLRPDPANPLNSVLEVRTADEVYGVEITVDGDITDKFRAGGSFAWVEGKEDKDGDGEPETSLQHRRIPPKKITAYVEHDIGGTWTVRVQGIYSGKRDKFPGSTAFYEGVINSWLVVDVSASGEVGPGRLSLGLNNALNTDYYTHLSEAMQQDNRYSKAPGMTASVKYRINY